MDVNQTLNLNQTKQWARVNPGNLKERSGGVHAASRTGPNSRKKRAMQVVKIQGEQARYILELLSELGIPTIYSLRIALDEGQVKFKVNESTWTPGFGNLEH